jgi:hypothetical protein
VCRADEIQVGQLISAVSIGQPFGEARDVPCARPVMNSFLIAAPMRASTHAAAYASFEKPNTCPANAIGICECLGSGIIAERFRSELAPVDLLVQIMQSRPGGYAPLTGEIRTGRGCGLAGDPAVILL